MTSREKRNAAAAGALGAKTARACDCCLRRRARWYCAADDAFLCQSCDSSVHSANPLASRHERVRLKTTSLKLPSCDVPGNDLPAWLHGLRRKARTPRHSKSNSSPPKTSLTLLVPDLASDDRYNDDNEEQLLYRVPIFDPVVAEFCSSSSPSEPLPSVEESKPPSAGLPHSTQQDNLPADFHPDDVDLAEFAADVESLLGRGLDDEGFCMDDLGLLESRKEETDWCFDAGRVKVEKEDVDGPTISQADVEFDLSRDTLDLNFECDSPTNGGEEEEEKVAVAVNRYTENGNKISLRLDYEAVIAAWASQGSPWTTGHRPLFNPDDGWPACLGAFASELHPYGEMDAMGQQAAVGDGGREARVSRYREKRRTRLFSKKIRYEVRKLNAEKRPRMKGRFVKRASFAGPGFPF
ncbi:zinc finger protein CONSTANS-LIKE 16-like [Aristolochia californica]|uniref:zinc finger protein CONSTANS-LIKE 16-like n=1 Tax=Aristolochia californica TaxID=171875 RepID=UPI0035E2A13E